MKVAVFNHRADEAEFFEKFTKQYGVEPVYIQAPPTVETIATLEGCEAASIITTPITEKELDAFKAAGVRFVSTRTIGFDHIDIEYAKKIGIAVGNVTYSPNSVAEYAVMLMLMTNRKVKTIMTRSMGQDYSLRNVRGRELRCQTVGVIGTGRIGRTVIDNLKGFGCKILAYDLYENDDVKRMAEYVPLERLMQESDIITLHAPSTDENYHMINDETIRVMKQGVVIINTARGALIDSEALIRGIECGQVGAAGLDVVENETAIYYKDFKDTPVNHRQIAILNSFPNVIMMPHTAFFTDMAVSDMVEHSIESCVEYIKQ